MNIFSVCGDISHFISFYIIILNICKIKSCSGISGKSQILFAAVFTSRYLDLFKCESLYISLYNDVCKISFLILSYLILFLIFFKYYSTYNQSKDTFSLAYVILPVILLAFGANYHIIYHGIERFWKNFLQQPYEIAWTFSIYLEALAIIPQYVMIINTGDGQSVFEYVLALTIYRSFYICNWVYRYLYENHSDLISSISGVVEVLIFILVLIAIEKCKLQNAKWQQITKIFTIEDARIKVAGEKENCSDVSDKENLLP